MHSNRKENTMKRKDFIKKAGTVGVGVGALALVRPTNVEGGGKR